MVAMSEKIEKLRAAEHSAAIAQQSLAVRRDGEWRTACARMGDRTDEQPFRHAGGMSAMRLLDSFRDGPRPLRAPEPRLPAFRFTTTEERPWAK